MTDGMEYEELPSKQYKIIKSRKSGKDSKMSKEAKTYNKTRTEHIKDIVIAVLVAGILAFVAGAVFANSNNTKIQEAVSAVTPTVSAESSK